MEVFLPDRDPLEVLALITRLRALGVQGRDASFLASVRPAASWDDSVRANYLKEFRYMVGPDRRCAVAELLGLDEVLGEEMRAQPVARVAG